MVVAPVAWFLLSIVGAFWGVEEWHRERSPVGWRIPWMCLTKSNGSVMHRELYSC